jgi:hypothetical protein
MEHSRGFVDNSQRSSLWSITGDITFVGPQHTGTKNLVSVNGSINFIDCENLRSLNYLKKVDGRILWIYKDKRVIYASLKSFKEDFTQMVNMPLEDIPLILDGRYLNRQGIMLPAFEDFLLDRLRKGR